MLEGNVYTPDLRKHGLEPPDASGAKGADAAALPLANTKRGVDLL
jgi:hypothetical protein